MAQFEPPTNQPVRLVREAHNRWSASDSPKGKPVQRAQQSLSRYHVEMDAKVRDEIERAGGAKGLYLDQAATYYR